MDILGNVVGIIAPLLLSFYVVMTGIFAKVDLIVQQNVDTYVKEFVDTSRSIGYISPENYMEMANDIYATSNRYLIEVEHRSKVAYPKEGIDSSTSYISGYNSHNRDEVVGSLFPESGENQNYLMKKGDFIRVKVKLAEPTFFQRFSSFFTGRTYETIRSNYGGYVGNTKQ